VVVKPYTPAILFWAYSYAGPSNFWRFYQIFWRIIHPYTPVDGSPGRLFSPCAVFCNI